MTHRKGTQFDIRSSVTELGNLFDAAAVELLAAQSAADTLADDALALSHVSAELGAAIRRLKGVGLRQYRHRTLSLCPVPF